MSDSMTGGVQHWVDSALDTKDDICQKMIDAGVEPKQALLASTVVTKMAVADELKARLEGKSAAEITSALKSHTSTNLLS